MHCSVTIICGRLTCYHCALFKCIFPSINYSGRAAPHWGTHLSARRAALWGPWFTQLQFCASFGPKPWWAATLVPAGVVEKRITKKNNNNLRNVMFCCARGKKKAVHQWMCFQVLKKQKWNSPPCPSLSQKWVAYTEEVQMSGNLLLNAVVWNAE